MATKAILSRRRFLKGATATAAAGYARRIFPSPNQTPAQRSAEPGPSPREKLSLFRYSEVKLTGGPLKEQFDRIHAAYLALDEDRLLKLYRLRAGLPAPGQDMGGWYDPGG
ncbi:MAG: hypothetical protein DMG26_21190, partial [Acidobacteria bacterium]